MRHIGGLVAIAAMMTLSLGCEVPNPGPGEAWDHWEDANGNNPLEVNLTPSVLSLRYGNSHADQVMDLYFPPGGKANQTKALIVWVHGGGWAGGDKDEVPSIVLRQVSRGYAVAAVNYRMTGMNGQGILHNAADVDWAIRWLKKMAPVSGWDASEIIVWGHSAGGQIAAFVGLSFPVMTWIMDTAVSMNGAPNDIVEDFDSQVDGIVSFAGFIDMVHYRDNVIAARDFRGPAGSGFFENGDPILILGPEAFVGDKNGVPEDQILEMASSFKYVFSSSPPIYIAYGDSDPASPDPLWEAYTLCSAYAAYGREKLCLYDIVEGYGHGPFFERFYGNLGGSTTFPEGANGDGGVGPDLRGGLNLVALEQFIDGVSENAASWKYDASEDSGDTP